MKRFVVSFFLLWSFLWSSLGAAKLTVVTTTQDWASVTESIAGDLVEVSAVAKGNQDAHFIEAKPSYMVRVSHADLVISTGLQLEIGWLPLLLQGARRPALLPGQPGYLEVAQAITPIEVLSQASRQDGDVHPQGNPHFAADPTRVLKVAELIAGKLGELDAPNKAKYQAGLAKFQEALKKRIADWDKRMLPFKGTKVIGYHKTFDYFFAHFGMEPVAFLEPKPGIPPTASHVLSLIDVAKQKKAKLIMNESFFDLKPARALAEKVPGLRIVVVPAYVGGDDRSKTYLDWMETLVSGIEKGTAL
jgi:zinc/manganese transport system substrate-binding protein